MPKPKSSILLLVCALATLPLQLSANSMAESPAFSLGPKELLELANQQAGVTSSPAVILLADDHWAFHDDRTIERKQHYIFKLLDQSAVQAWSSIQERWEPWHQDRPVFRARVITPDGVAHELDPKTLSDAPAGSNSPQSYSDLRVLQGPLPAIAVGAIVEYEMTERMTPVLGSLSFRSYVASGVPVRFSRFTAESPESLPFRYTVDRSPDLKSSSTTSNGVVHVTLLFGAFDPVTQVDPLLPFGVPRAATVSFSTGASWNNIAIEYGKLVDRQIADAPVQNLVGKSLGGEKDRSVIIRKLVSTLHAEVRYTGVEFADAAIVPAKPAETLSRKYGDCKDKASLLVAMLRAAGIPSYIALLNAGLEQDIAARYPGMGMFNHAIVYVPGAPELWIDATAEHTPVGSLLPPDEGRLALIVRPETNELTKIPESTSADNTTTTEFDYSLPEFGPSHVVESVSGTGPFDSTYRDMVALLDNEEIRKGAEKQAQAEWNTKAEIKVSHPPLDDLSKPFRVTTDVPDTKALMISETGAALTLPVQSVFAALPQFFTIDNAKDDNSTGKKTPRTEGFVLPTAFIGRVSCRVHIPAGLVLKRVPDDQTAKLGPAIYKAHYALANQTLTAEISFDSVKRNYTLDEGMALRSAAIELLKQPAPVLNFEPLGQSLIDEGRLREGLGVFRELAARQDARAVNHIRLARAYLKAGCGQEARSEAKIANQLAPALPVTWRNLAFIHEHDLIGRQYKRGWDPAIVETALRKAISLDPDDVSANIELAESFSYDASGSRFESRERLAQAIDLFRQMGDDKVEQQGAQDTMIYELAILGNLDAVKSALDRFGANGSRAGYQVFLRAVQEGSPKAAAGLRASASGEELKQAFSTAVTLLSLTGRYELEADLATDLGLKVFIPTANLRSVRRIDPLTLQPDSPENLVRCFFVAQYDPGETPESQARFWSASASDRLPAVLRRWRQALFGDLSQQGLAPSVGRDVYLSNVKMVADANGSSGYRVRLTIGGRTFSLYVERENGSFKLLGTSDMVEGPASRAFTDLRGGNLESARKWLDWLREDLKIHSDDDPLGGPVFPRLWSKGAPASAAQVRYAAAALMYSQESLSILQEAIGSASDPTVKAYYQLAYTRSCVYMKSWGNCLAVAKSLALAYPASDTALALVAQSSAGAGQVEAAEQTLRKAIADSPDDLGLRRSLTNSLILGNRITQSLQLAKEIAETPNASPFDWNQYGWLSLFAGNTDEPMIHALERGQGQPHAAIENTIAAMYAEIGKLNEARQLSLQTLDKFGYDTPDSAWWYVFGRISDQLGAKASAVLYYEKVQPDGKGEDLLSVHSLAVRRLAALNVGNADGR